MGIILGLYLMIAGVLAAGHKDGIIEDTTALSTYQFEADAARSNGDLLKATYCEGRVDEIQNGK